MTQLNTINVDESVHTGGLRTGDDSSKDVILIFASCRGVPHLNYFKRYNDDHGKPFMICFVNPHSFEMQNKKPESDDKLKEICGRATVFIHEHYQSYGWFNTDRSCVQNAYQLGVAPRTDISIPNWHNHSVILNDQIVFGGAFCEKVRMCGNPLSDRLLDEFKLNGESALNKWRESCLKTSFPEFVDYFDAHWTLERMFTSNSHVSNYYTVPLFSMLCRKFLGIALSQAYEKMLHGYDLFTDKGGVPVTQYDRDAFGVKWDEPNGELMI